MQTEISEAVETLKRGGVVAFPTDTVYGLGADAFNSAAVARIYDIKGRPRDRQLPLLIADAERLTALADPVPGIAWFLTGRFWPGGLTLVLPKANSLPAHLASGAAIAARVPAHPVCLALIQGLGNPIIGTSANLSGQPSVLTADEVVQQLGGKIDFIVNAGRCPGGRESTVVDVTGQSPVVLREGIIPSCEIDRACQEYLKMNEASEGVRTPGARGGPDTPGMNGLRADHGILPGGSGS